MKAAICIPTFREASSIRRVVERVDQGLKAMMLSPACVIVNIDSDSDDGTCVVFGDTPTHARKHSIVIRDSVRGKGNNLLRFFEYCLENGIEVAATIDGDITTVDERWVSALLSPLISGEAQYVTPLYTRSPFEGSTTNHFAYPLLYGYFGTDMRQPIGGEFGFTGGVAAHLSQQSVTNSVRGYGIDIFMTIHAIGKGYKHHQAPLGCKLHKPSFPKIASMFSEVALTALEVLPKYTNRWSEPSQLSNPFPSIAGGCTYNQRDQAHLLYRRALQDAKQNQSEYGKWPIAHLSRFLSTLHEAEPQVSVDVWTDVLAGVVRHVIDRPEAKKSQVVSCLTPLFLMRAVTFWEQCANAEAEQIDAWIGHQAHLLRSKLQSGGA